MSRKKNNKINVSDEINYAFSGHETFPVRVAWLPKAVSAVSRGEDPFSNPREGMRILGLGKNMVLSLKCWSEYFGVIERRNEGWTVTNFGDLILGSNGRDPFLEDERSLWLLHWAACTNTKRPFFAWHWLVNLCQDAEFSLSEALDAFMVESDKYSRSLSPVTLRQHLDVFLRVYVASDSSADRVPEDLLDSPLSSLGFIQKSGDRLGQNGRDYIYSIDNRKKNSIPSELFRFCLHSWWDQNFSHEQTALFSDVAFGKNTPGRVFRMPEIEIRDRLVSIAQKWPDEFEILEGSNQRMVRRVSNLCSVNDALNEIYGGAI